MTRPLILALIALVGGAAVLALLGGRPNLATLITATFIWATVGVSWNLFSGLSGDASFGHAGFFGIGAYTSVLLQIHFGISPLIAFLPAAVIAAAAAVMIGRITFRLSGIYFSLATLTYPLMLIPLGHYLGVQELSVPYIRENGGWHLQFADPRNLGYVAIVLFAVAIAVAAWVERSPLGARLKAIRDDEPAAAAAGVDTRLAKMQGFALSAAIAAMAGVIYANVLLVVTPDAVFGLRTSVLAVLVPIVGGAGALWGPLAGAAIVVPLSDLLNAALGATKPGLSGLVYGGIVVAIILFAPEGLIWRLHALLPRRRTTTAPAASESEFAAAKALFSRPVTADGLALAVRGLSRSYGGLQALSTVQFDVADGELLGIIGPNGAGKTTLFNVVNGFVAPNSGTVSLHGQDVTALSTHRRFDAGLGRTFQVVRVFRRLTVRENVLVAALSAADGTVDAERLCDAALLVCGIRDLADAPAETLDTRQLRIMELARALAGRPKLLLVDEYLAGQSPSSIADLVRLLRLINSFGITVVVIEHTIGALLDMVDRLIVLDRGTIIAGGKPDATIALPAVVEAYLGKKWVRHAAG
jgi:branched-chain amino acid transport system permease protein